MICPSRISAARPASNYHSGCQAATSCLLKGRLFAPPCCILPLNCVNSGTCDARRGKHAVATGPEIGSTTLILKDAGKATLQRKL